MVCSASGSRRGFAGSDGQMPDCGVVGFPGEGVPPLLGEAVTGGGGVTSPSGTTDATLGSDASRARSAFDTCATKAFNTVNWWVTAPPERAMLAINGRRWARCTLARALTLATLASRPFCW